MKLNDLKRLVIGASRDPFDPATRGHIAVAAFLAWVGLGADGLSSACYGPEEAFLALGQHTHLGLFLAVMTAVTVFVIALAYNQVIELFPTGGGGYKVATQLVGPRAGLVSGSALIVDYVLTIAISVASGTDAFFSLLPAGAQAYKLSTEAVMVGLLIVLNLRGVKESILVLLPIFIGFVVTHVGLIVYGIVAQAPRLPSLVPDTVQDTLNLTREVGWVGAVALFLRAYSLGGGTYTGIEAVSNNVNMLKEPRVVTGKLTMFYMALSLSFVAGGVILLYLLWQASPVHGQTLNAVTFRAIMAGWQVGGVDVSGPLLAAVLAFEAGLLLVAANTGFLGGPAVLANMAQDSWAPNQFRQLSNRLVTQNGVLLMGAAALAIIFWSRGSVGLLVVLYSINVFLTFSLSLLGLCIFWWRFRGAAPHWKKRLALSASGLVITGGILVVTVVEKFSEGGWITLLITGVVIALGALIRGHYQSVRTMVRKADEEFPAKIEAPAQPAPPLDPQQPTAVFFIGKNRGTGMHGLLWVQRLFPGHFRNFIFISVGEVDTRNYAAGETLKGLQYDVETQSNYFVNYCRSHGLAAAALRDFGTDPVQQATRIAEQVQRDFPNSVFFASKLIFEPDRWFYRFLHNQTALALQRCLHLRGMQMVVLPMKV